MFFTYVVSGIEATQKGPSKAWYLLPIFIRIIGGLIMYFALTNRDAKMAEIVAQHSLAHSRDCNFNGYRIFWIES